MNLIFGKCNGKKLSEKVGIGIGERNGRNDENAGNQSGNDRNPENQDGMSGIGMGIIFRINL